MASYVPPHKRLTSKQVGPPPTPALMDPQMTNKRGSRVKSGIAYAHRAISRCLAVPLRDDGKIPSSVHCVPISSGSNVWKVEWKPGHEPLTLVDNHVQQECRDVKDCHLKKPWVSVAEKVHSDLLLAFQNVKDQMANAGLDKMKPGVFARFGKVLYHRSLSLSGDQPNECSISETRLGSSRRIFHTDVPVSYAEHIKNEVAPNIGIHFGGMKEKHKLKFFIRLTDNMRPDSFIRCKCRIQEGEQKLELYKIESMPLRHLIMDISCLDSHVDLRLALVTVRDLTSLNDEEKQTIGDLIRSAILDPNVKGGLRWPLGVANSGARFRIAEVCLTTNVFYINSSMRLTVREADRYDLGTSTGSVSREIFLKLKGITRTMMEEETDANVVSTLLEDTLKMIWEHFLKWDGNLVQYSES